MDDDDDEDVGGGTDEEVPAPGENYFGRAAKEGAAPAGANPFAAPPPSAEDDWAAQIAGKCSILITSTVLRFEQMPSSSALYTYRHDVYKAQSEYAILYKTSTE